MLTTPLTMMMTMLNSRTIEKLSLHGAVFLLVFGLSGIATGAEKYPDHIRIGRHYVHKGLYGVTDVSLSASTNRFVFSNKLKKEAKQDLYIGECNTSTLIKLNQESGLYGNPRMSPDGKRVLADFSDESSDHKIIIWEEDSTSSKDFFLTARFDGSGGVWAPEGDFIVYFDGRNLHRYDVVAKKSRHLMRYEENIRRLQIIDERTILFWQPKWYGRGSPVGVKKQHDYDVVIFNTDTQEKYVLPVDEYTIGNAVLTNNRKFLVWDPVRSAYSNIKWMDISEVPLLKQERTDSNLPRTRKLRDIPGIENLYKLESSNNTSVLGRRSTMVKYPDSFKTLFVIVNLESGNVQRHDTFSEKPIRAVISHDGNYIAIVTHLKPNSRKGLQELRIYDIETDGHRKIVPRAPVGNEKG